MLNGPLDTPHVRVLNAQTVLDLIRSRNPITRIEIARAVGISKPTASNVVETLLRAGLVRELPNGANGGRGAQYAPVDQAAYAIGVDVGGHYLRAALSDLAGRVVARQETPHDDADPDELARLAAQLRDRLLVAAGVGFDEVAATVVGVPGIVDPRMGTITRTNPFRTPGIPIARAFEAALGHSAVVENDVNLAALGEQWRGAGQGVDDFAVLSIGTGVGCGLVLDGRLHRGANGAAGEIDMPGAPDSPAEHALVELIARAGGPSDTTTPAPRTLLQILFSAVSAGEAWTEAVLDELVGRLSSRIACLVRVVDLELVVLSGGIGVQCGPLEGRIRAELERLVHFPPRIEVSSLGDDPVLTGALALSTQRAARATATSRLTVSSR